MAGVDLSRAFKPISIAVLTVSDTRKRANDTSGDLLEERLTKAGHLLGAREIVRDDVAAIRKLVSGWIADPGLHAVITTGGTGLTGRDVTVEALRPLFEKEIEGFSAVFHQISYGTVGTSTLASRATAGLANGTLIFCLPGSTGACKDGWDGILLHQLDSRHRPCNLVELLPRLMEK